MCEGEKSGLKSEEWCWEEEGIEELISPIGDNIPNWGYFVYYKISLSF